MPTYTYNPGATTKDKIRTVLGDTKSEWLLSDEEISDHLAIASNDFNRAVSSAANAAAVKAADQDAVTGQNFGSNVSIQKQGRASILLALAKRYDKLATSGAAPYYAVSSYDSGVDAFGRDTTEYVGDN